MGVLKGVVY